jgi:tRNA1Val (adenine37-N6)-methyltransferase
MKISSAATVFAAHIDGSNAKTILDIGTGTGLLSLMLAQRFPLLQITAIELDADAASQAAENFAESPWAHRIKVVQGDVLTYDFGQTFDLIVCNPPFFQSALAAQDPQRNLARHAVTLNPENLLAKVQELLSPNGTFFLLIASNTLAHYTQLLAQYDFWIVSNIHLVDRVGKPPFCEILQISRFKPDTITETSFPMQEPHGGYSREQVALLYEFLIVF